MSINIHIYIINIIFTLINPLCVGIMFFALRSTKGVTRLSSAERILISISNYIKDILVGVLLGDAHIVRRSSTGNSRLVYAQTAIALKEYFNYVYSFFIPFCAKDYISQSRLIRDNRTKKKYIVLYLSQLCNFPVLMNLKKCFIN
jgi:hypothetical protein